MNKKLNKLIQRIAISTAFFIIGVIIPFKGFVEIALLTAAYIIVGYDVIIRAIRNIGRGQVFDEHFLMTIATFGAFATSQVPEGVMVMLLYQVGELFQQYAVGKSRTSIAELMNIRPDYANIIRSGQIVTIDPEEVKVGDKIVIKPGEKVPLDGIITKGKGFLDTSALTGESVPREIHEGQEVLSGCINVNGTLEVTVTKEFNESTVAKILELVENASERKAKAENFITKFSKYYTPIVVLAALGLAFLPWMFGSDIGLGEWIIRACTFLVISCPCALVISVPLSFFGGIGGAAKQGILIKGSNYMETLANMDVAVFDKTGTLTKGFFEVNEIIPEEGITENEVLESAVFAEIYSNHPISISLQKAYKEKVDKQRIGETEEISGKGVKTTVDGEKIYVGNEKLMRHIGLDCPEVEKIGTIVYVAKGHKYIGYILISDEIKKEAVGLAEKLHQTGISEILMLTGDREKIAEKIGREVGVDQVYSELLPGDKVSKVEEILIKCKGSKKLAFIGDGINDAPVLTRADIGIAMGGLGSDAAIEAADVVIMDDNLTKIVRAVSIARKTITIVKQNIVFALGVKGVFLVLGGFGIASLWEAVFADVGVSIIAILNSMRALKQSNGASDV